MQQGFVPDGGNHGSFAIPQWIEGPPERSFWTGLKLKGRTRIPVTTFRCERCGLLECYALPPE